MRILPFSSTGCLLYALNHPYEQMICYSRNSKPTKSQIHLSSQTTHVQPDLSHSCT
ncbi:hypothetical protein M404DRAFT_432939 [Pisolithus tinctorius Marx 270]|uniref:Uncharacterized protein n=1 Tax=Pisolithus tinctorius Marx 270 TaxID=870435 RepID=A0A0C3MYD8_PISTI|nr:hypothetical protein M404DRAFT_432939 [Pisolithus tinctorius Marx 270]